MHTLVIPKNMLSLFEGMLVNCEKIGVTNQYEHARYKAGPLSIILYKSGKVVFSEIPSRPLSTTIIDFLASIDPFDTPVIGSDEAGKGEVIGPLVVGAVLLRTKQERAEARFYGAMDSKNVSSVQLERVYNTIKTHAHSIRVLSPSDFNKRFNNNLNEILLEMHFSAIEPLLRKLGDERCKVIIDKFGGKVQDEELKKRIRAVNQNADVTIVTKAEQFTPVACASILAKHEYEKWIDSFNEKCGCDVHKLDKEKLKTHAMLSDFAKRAYIK